MTNETGLAWICEDEKYQFENVHKSANRHF